jgi:hypothetical protein
MLSTRKVWAAVAVLCAGGLLASAARADEASFKKAPTNAGEQKTLANDLTMAVLQALRPTGQNKTVEAFEFKENDPKPNRTTLVIRATFLGKVTKKKYNADIRVVIDSTQKNTWEALEITYNDNDKTPILSKDKKLKDIRDRFNK